MERTLSAPEASQTRVGLTEKTAVPVAVHRFPAVAKTTEVHLVLKIESMPSPCGL